MTHEPSCDVIEPRAWLDVFQGLMVELSSFDEDTRCEIAQIAIFSSVDAIHRSGAVSTTRSNCLIKALDYVADNLREVLHERENRH